MAQTPRARTLFGIWLEALVSRRARPYLAAMALFRRSGMWRDVSPGGAIGDFITVFRQAGKNRWRIAGLALLPPLGILVVFLGEEARGKPKPPEVTLITSWRADRSQAEIIASNIANQRVQDRLDAEQAQREAEVRGIYKTIGRASGIDVDAVDRQAAADRAAERAKSIADSEALRRHQEQALAARQAANER